MTNYISQEGLDKLKEELSEVKEKRYEISRRIEEAKSLGDLSENHEYHEAREAQSFNEGRLRELEEKIRDAEIIEDQKSKGGVVDLGSSITVKNGGQEKKFTVVGSEEADPASGKISNESPIGRAFLGKKAGEKIEVETPAGKTVYKILSVG